MLKKGSNIVLLIFYSLVSIALFFDYLIGSRFYNTLTFNPSRIINYFEFYRIFSFPFAVNQLESFFILTFSFTLIVPKFRNLYPKRTFTLFQLITVICALVAITVPLKSIQLNFSGAELVSFYILSQAIMFLSNKKIKFRDNFYVSYQLIAIVIFAVWLVMRVYTYIYINPILLNYDIVSMAIALSFSDFIRLRIKYLKKLQIAENTYKAKLSSLNYNEPAPAYVSTKTARRNQRSKVKSEYFFLDDENLTEEDKLNIILDKINETGKESLGRIEMKFLEEYSKNLK